MPFWNQSHWNSGGFWGPSGSTSTNNNPKQRKPRPMKRNEYYPTLKAEQPEWLNNLAAKMVTYTGALGLDPVTVGKRANDCRCLAWYIGDVSTAVRDFGKAYTAAAESLSSGSGEFVPPAFVQPPLPTTTPPTTLVDQGALTRITLYVKIIKASEGYTEAIGIDMGIVGTEATKPEGPPDFTLDTIMGPDCHCAVVKYKKRGHMAVVIQGKVGAGDWVELSVSTQSPYTDSRPLAVAGQPEVREYRLRYWDDGAAVGEWSAVQKITIAP